MVKKFYGAIQIIEYFRLNIEDLRFAFGGSIKKTYKKRQSGAISINLQSSIFNLQFFRFIRLRINQPELYLARRSFPIAAHAKTQIRAFGAAVIAVGQPQFTDT